MTLLTRLGISTPVLQPHRFGGYRATYIVGALAFGLGLSGLSVTAFAASETFCKRYARDIAFTIPHDRPSLSKECRDDPRWTVSKSPIDPRIDIAKNENYQWCLNASEDEVNQKRYAHNRDVNACNNEYLTLSLSTGKVSTPPTSDTAIVKMQEVPAGSIVGMLESSDTKNPYAGLFAQMAKNLAKDKLADCTFRSLLVDMDNTEDTQEWAVTTDQKCLKSSSNTPHLWLIQRSGMDYRVLFEGEDSVIKLRNSMHNGYKDIHLTTSLTSENSKKGVCGAIAAEWQFVDGRYLPFDAKPVVDDACISYDLPDQLVGVNTASMTAEEWEEAMLQEDKRRQKLAIPIEKKLQDYMPQWVRHIRKVTSGGASKAANKAIEPSPGKTKKPAKKEQVLGIDADGLQWILDAQ